MEDENKEERFKRKKDLKRDVLFFQLAILLLIIFSTCGTEPDSKSDEPVTQGLYFTDETGLIYDEWRNPSSLSQKSEFFQFIHPYPNPSSRILMIEIDIKSDQAVDIWVLPTRIEEEDQSNFAKEYGIESISNDRVQTIYNGNLETGINSIQWALHDNSNNRLPRGFYRIYVETNGETLWHDVFIGNLGELGRDIIDELKNLDN